MVYNDNHHCHKQTLLKGGWSIGERGLRNLINKGKEGWVTNALKGLWINCLLKSKCIQDSYVVEGLVYGLHGGWRSLGSGNRTCCFFRMGALLLACITGGIKPDWVYLLITVRLLVHTWKLDYYNHTLGSLLRNLVLIISRDGYVWTSLFIFVNGNCPQLTSGWIFYIFQEWAHRRPCTETNAFWCQYVNAFHILHTMTLEIQTRSKKTRHNQNALIEQALKHWETEDSLQSDHSEVRSVEDGQTY